MAIDLSKILNNPYANKVSSVVDFTNFSSNALNEYFVKPEQLNFGINGFRFSIRGEESVEVQSEITDNWLENNFASQDHIALKPEIITLSGLVGEVFDRDPGDLKDVNKEIEKLTTLSPFLPALTTQAKAIYNSIERNYKIYEKANEDVQNTFKTFKGITTSHNMNQQQLAFEFFYFGWKTRQLYVVQTPYTVFNNMAIMNMRATQDETTNQVSNFEITFKKIRITQNIQSQKTKFQGRAAAQVQSQVDKGVQKPQQKSTALNGLQKIGLLK